VSKGSKARKAFDYGTYSGLLAFVFGRAVDGTNSGLLGTFVLRVKQRNKQTSN